MLRAETNFKISTFRFNFVKFDFHATSESTFRFLLATGPNGQRTNSYAHKLDLYYGGAIFISFVGIMHYTGSADLGEPEVHVHALLLLGEKDKSHLELCLFY